jgi:hypothetical protein
MCVLCVLRTASPMPSSNIKTIYTPRSQQGQGQQQQQGYGGGGGGSPELDRCNLIVNYLPNELTDDGLRVCIYIYMYVYVYIHVLK